MSRWTFLYWFYRYTVSAPASTPHTIRISLFLSEERAVSRELRALKRVIDDGNSVRRRVTVQREVLGYKSTEMKGW